MKLILSSLDFNNEYSKKTIIDNIDKPLSECRLLFIPNEKADEQRIYSNKYYNRLKKHGFDKKNIYVFDDKKASNFISLDIDLIYVGGGNTFATLKKIKDSHFDTEIVKYVNSGVTYIGGSCGAHIVSKNIEHLSSFDSNDVNLTDLEGLGLFDGIIVLHYNEENFEPIKRKNLYLQLLKENKYKVYTLTNNESLVIKDNSVIKM